MSSPIMSTRSTPKSAAAGAEITAELHDTDFGSHTFSLRDTEGNAWTIGTYRGAP